MNSVGDYLARAMKAYFRWSNARGLTPTQPSEDLSGVETRDGKDYAVLRNANGVLKAYVITRHALRAVEFSEVDGTGAGRRPC